MNLHDKTPQQLNMMVAEIIFIGREVVSHPANNYSALVSDSMGGISLDYCGDDALAFRLMVEFKIMPIYSNGLKKWAATHHSLGLHVETRFMESLNRAIVETFIRMNQHKEG